MCQTTPAAIAQAGNGLFVVKLGWVWLGEAVDTQQERPNYKQPNYKWVVHDLCLLFFVLGGAPSADSCTHVRFLNLELRGTRREAGGHHRAIDHLLARLFDETLFRIPELPSVANGLVREVRSGMPSMRAGFETGVVGSLPVDPSNKFSPASICGAQLRSRPA